MTKEEYQDLANFVVSRLQEVEPGVSLSLKESEDILQQSEDIWESEGEQSARLFLLKKVMGRASACRACDRHCQRVNPCPAEGILDIPMIVGDYPGYSDTLAGRPFVGSSEMLLSHCGNCQRLEEHFKKCIHPIHQAEMTIPKNEQDAKKLCTRVPVYSPNVDRKIRLPIAFQLGKEVKPLGTPGQVLDRLLLDLGLSRSGWRGKCDVYITNALLCPSLNDVGENNPVKAAQRKACHNWFELQVKIVKPPVIVCMGLESIYRVLGSQVAKKGLVNLRGNWQVSFELGCPVGITYHPSMAIKKITGNTSENYQKILEDLEKFLKGDPP